MTKSISVILPVRNMEIYIEDCIMSILEQTFDDFELIIINDGSVDKTKEMILSIDDNRIIYFENKNSQGITKCLNKGIYFSKGHYLARMDGDDISYKNRFEEQLSFFEDNPEIDILGSAITIIPANRNYYYPINNDEIRVQLLQSNALSHPSVMMRKGKIIENKLYYDKDAIFTEDYKLWMDASINKVILHNIDKPLLYYRHHKNQTTNSKNYSQYFSSLKLKLAYGNHFFGDLIEKNKLLYLSLVTTKLQHKNNYHIDQYDKLICDILKYNQKSKLLNNTLLEEFLFQRLFSLKCIAECTDIIDLE